MQISQKIFTNEKWVWKNLNIFDNIVILAKKKMEILLKMGDSYL